MKKHKRAKTSLWSEILECSTEPHFKIDGGKLCLSDQYWDGHYFDTVVRRILSALVLLDRYARHLCLVGYRKNEEAIEGGGLSAGEVSLPGTTCKLCSKLDPKSNAYRYVGSDHDAIHGFGLALGRIEGFHVPPNSPRVCHLLRVPKECLKESIHTIDIAEPRHRVGSVSTVTHNRCIFDKREHMKQENSSHRWTKLQMRSTDNMTPGSPQDTQDKLPREQLRSDGGPKAMCADTLQREVWSGHQFYSCRGKRKWCLSFQRREEHTLPDR